MTEHKIVTDRPSFQGDICIYRVSTIPASAVPAQPEGGLHIVAHSETGHHHVIDSRNAQMLIDSTNAFIAWVRVTGPDAAILTHLRDYDTHAPLALTPGEYKVHRQRESAPEGWRRAAD